MNEATETETETAASIIEEFRRTGASTRQSRMATRLCQIFKDSTKITSDHGRIIVFEGGNYLAVRRRGFSIDLDYGLFKRLPRKTWDIYSTDPHKREHFVVTTDKYDYKTLGEVADDIAWQFSLTLQERYDAAQDNIKQAKAALDLV